MAAVAGFERQAFSSNTTKLSGTVPATTHPAIMTSRIRRNIWRSKRLIIRPVEPTDDAFLQSLTEETSDDYQNSTPFVPVPQGAAGAKSFREFMEKCLVGCIICLPAPNAPEPEPATTASDSPPKKPVPTPIGTISLMATEVRLAHHRNTEIGVTIATSYQGQGYGSEAVLWALEWAFRHANMHRVDIRAFGWNEGAWKLYERLGFVLEGRKREAMWYDGAYHDAVELGMLRSEWQARYGETKADGHSV
jgi:ribosomal protein S18 acetylase RimI-like enzyme